MVRDSLEWQQRRKVRDRFVTASEDALKVRDSLE
jgi:hypothetical protein